MIVIGHVKAGNLQAEGADEIKELIAPYDFVRKMRASYYVLGPLLARFRHADISHQTPISGRPL